MSDEDVILTICNMELKITKEGKIQVRAKEGIVVIEPQFKVKRGETTTELTSAFTTTSTTWVDITGLSFDEIKFDPKITEAEKTRLKKLISYLNENKSFLLQIVNFIANLSKHL